MVGSNPVNLRGSLKQLPQEARREFSQKRSTTCLDQFGAQSSSSSRGGARARLLRLLRAPEHSWPRTLAVRIRRQRNGSGRRQAI